MLRIFKLIALLALLAASGSASAQAISRPFYCSECLLLGAGMPANPDTRTFFGTTVNSYRLQHTTDVRNAASWEQGSTVIICNASSCAEFTYRSGFWTQTSKETPNENKPGEYTNDKPPVLPPLIQAGGGPADGNGGATGTGGPNTGIGVGAGVCFGPGCFAEIGRLRQV